MEADEESDRDPRGRQTFSRDRLAFDPLEASVRFHVFVPDDLRPVLRTAERAARLQFGPELTRSQCLVVWREDFAATWSPADKQARADRRRLLERDGYRCAVPGCTSRAGLHEHHVRVRSRNGGDEEENRLVLCGSHHLRHVHEERMRISGRAPDHLTFEGGLVNGTPFAVYQGERLVGGPRDGRSTEEAATDLAA